MMVMTVLISNPVYVHVRDVISYADLTVDGRKYVEVYINTPVTLELRIRLLKSLPFPIKAVIPLEVRGPKSFVIENAFTLNFNVGEVEKMGRFTISFDTPGKYVCRALVGEVNISVVG